MEVLGLVESLELEIHRLRFGHIGANRKVLLVFLCDEVFEFLLDF